MNLFKKYWPYLILALTVLIFFNKYFIEKLVPAPLDIITGMYFPYLNHKWDNQVGVAVKNPLLSDIVSIILEWRYLAIENIKKFKLPFWNPYNFLGTPLFANFQNSLLNLSNLIFLLPVSFIDGWSLSLIIQVIVSLFFTYMFFKNRNFSHSASLVGSIIYTYSLFSIVWLEYGIHGYVASFLPLFLFFIDKYIQTQNSRYLKFLSFAVMFQIFGGYPQYVIFSLMTVGFYVLFCHRQYLIHPKLLISILAGILLASPLLIPGVDLIKKSIRDVDVTATKDSYGLLLPKNLIFFISPNFFGNPATYDYTGDGWYDNNTIYPGIFALISLISVIIFSKKIPKKFKNISYFSIFLIVFSFISFVQSPISIFLKNHFGLFFSGGGISTKIFFMANLGFCILSAVAYDALISKYFLVGPLVLLILNLSILFLLKLGFFVSPVGQKNTIYQLATISAFLIIIVTTSVSKKFSNFFKFLLLPLTIFELFYFSNKYLPFSPKRYFFPETPSITFIKNNIGTQRVSTSTTIPQNMWSMYGLRSADGYDTLLPKKTYIHLQSVNNSSQFMDKYAYRASTYRNFDSPQFNQFSIKYFLTNDPQPFLDYNRIHQVTRFQTVFVEAQTNVVEDTKTLPRAILTKAQYSDDPYKFLAQDSSEIYISDPEYLSQVELVNSCDDDQSNAKFIDDTDNYISLTTTSKCPRFLVLFDSNDSGWRVTVDDKKTKLLTANFNFRSVFLDPGNHVVKFSYIPKYFELSMLICLLSLIFVFIWK